VVQVAEAVAGYTYMDQDKASMEQAGSMWDLAVEMAVELVYMVQI
jgi:hypothetical protein